VTSSLAASDVQSPSSCSVVDAPYGIESAGPDAVVPLTGLHPGTGYIVQLASPADLAFYVVTGCSTANGPASSECQLFVDASAGTEEVGRFVAEGTTAYVVVDYYASSTPGNGSFTLDVYPEACQSNAQCSGGMPVCFRGRCVECEDSFDCDSVATPVCSSTNTCTAGIDQCQSDDASEPDDDGPAGATALVLDGSGAASVAANICSTPRTEADFYTFTVTSVGEIWNLSLTWTGTADLDLEVMTATGDSLGLSYWEQPESIQLTYLSPGTYRVRVSEFSPQSSSPTPYSLGVQRTSGSGCTGTADCATTYRNQLFRGACIAGSCVPITATSVAAGGACDSEADCTTGLHCPSFYFTANADTRDVCAPGCASDGECATMGANYVCTSYLQQNMCVQRCTTDDQCPVALDSRPLAGPWYRLRCNTTSGRCVP
jgi:hypothetical protein